MGYISFCVDRGPQRRVTVYLDTVCLGAIVMHQKQHLGSVSDSAVHQSFFALKILMFLAKNISLTNT